MTREEAIKVIKAWDFLNKDEKEAIETLIPELKESEDERISREITEFILTHRIDEPNDIEDTNTWLAWLEKQGELISEAYEKGFTEGKRVERQHWLDKVCKWLNENMEDHTQSYEDYEVHSVEPTDYSFKKDFIEAFRKTMEE